MSRRLSNRVCALERTRATICPHILECSPGETHEEAVERFIAKHGAIERDHAFIVVPPRIEIHERPAKEAQWIEQQRRLYAEVRTLPKDIVQ
jgi:hypothetical protein